MSALRRHRWAIRLAILSLGYALVCLLAGTSASAAFAQSQAPIPALDSPVVDATGTLDAATRSRLERRAFDLQQRKGSQLQILVVASTQPESIEQYTQRVFDAWKLGRKGVDDGVLLVVAKDDHRVRIQTGYGLEGAIPDVLAGRVIQEYLVPKFRAGDFGGGIDDASQQLVRLIDGETLPPPMAGSHGRNGSPDLPFGLIAAFIAASVVRALFRAIPTVLRGLITGLIAAGVVWLMLSIASLAALAGILGFLYGLMQPGSGSRFSGGGGWGSDSGGWSDSGGGGWSGGGGSSGGGGASGSW